MSYTLIRNESKKRYEFHIDGKTALVEYIKAQDRIYLTHTEVPQSLEGQGVGSALIKAVLQEVEEMKLGLVPLCPFVAMYIKKHPEYQKLVHKDVKINNNG